MKLDEVIGLLAMINQYDTRIDPTDGVAQAWLAAVEPEMPLSWAAQQIIRYYAEDNRFLVTVGWLNTQWRKQQRDQHWFKGLPEPKGTQADKDRARWWMMQGITEGVNELNTGTSRDAWITPILRLRMKCATNLKTLHHKDLFRTLDWQWFEDHRDVYGKQLT